MTLVSLFLVSGNPFSTNTLYLSGSDEAKLGARHPNGPAREMSLRPAQEDDCG